MVELYCAHKTQGHRDTDSGDRILAPNAPKQEKREVWQVHTLPRTKGNRPYVGKGSKVDNREIPPIKIRARHDRHLSPLINSCSCCRSDRRIYIPYTTNLQEIEEGRKRVFRRRRAG